MANLDILVYRFYSKQLQFKRQQESFEDEKNSFYESMELAGKDSYDVSFKGLDISVKRIQKSTVLFDAVKLSKKLSKELSALVIRKKYIINDYKGLVSYLKSCGVNPDKFKSFISTEYSVDNDSLNQLSDLGKIDKNDLFGCYEVKMQKPYFKVTGKKTGSE